MKELLIIGAGPAGLTACIYAIRAGIDCAVLEKFSPGGQVVNTFEVENYPGFVDPIEGWDLMQKMENQAKRLGAEFLNGEVKAVTKKENHFEISLTDGNVLEAKTVIAATGAAYRKLGAPGEKEFTGRGVSYCATCDGAFFRDKVTAVVGGGDVALEEAIFLTRFASKVYIVHRRDQFRGAKILQERLLASEKVEPVYDSTVESIEGEKGVQKLVLKNKKSGETSDLPVDGVFIFIGFDPITSYLPSEVLNENREVLVDMKMHTPVDGLFAAGDLRVESGRQIVMAAADGAMAAMEAYEYLQNI